MASVSECGGNEVAQAGPIGDFRQLIAAFPKGDAPAKRQQPTNIA